MDMKLSADLKKLQDKALLLGATAAKVVRISSVKVGSWTRVKCQYGCPNYGKTLCCPPYTPDYPTMKRFLSEYKYGIIVEATEKMKNLMPRDDDPPYEERRKGLLDILLGMERYAFTLNYYRAFALKDGCCRLCKTCNLKKCIHAADARPSLEACGIDVFALVNDNGFDMKVITGPVEELKVYGMLLVN